MQFADYAAWEQRTRATRIDVHDAHWSAHLAGAKRLKVFADEDARSNPHQQKAHIFTLDQSLVLALRDFSVARGTTLMMSLLTVYVTLLSHWCNTPDVVVVVPVARPPYPEIENSVGPFGAPLFLRIAVSRDDSFVDLLTRVIDEYSTACEHNDSGKLAMRPPKPGFLLNPVFNFFSKEYFTIHADNWSGGGRPEAPLEESTFTFDGEPIDYGRIEPLVAMFERQDDVFGWLEYQRDLATAGSLERFVEKMQLFARSLVEAPNGRLDGIT